MYLHDAIALNRLRTPCSTLPSLCASAQRQGRVFKVAGLNSLDLCNMLRVRLSGVTDNSLYPVMFMSYLDVLVPGLKDSWQRTCVTNFR